MLSVGIITFNEELRLERTLKAVQGLADEIVIVDSFSTDGTVEIPSIVLYDVLAHIRYAARQFDVSLFLP